MSLIEGTNSSYGVNQTNLNNTPTNSVVQSNEDVSVPTTQGIPIDTVAFASKALFAGIGTSNVALNVNLKKGIPNTFDAIRVDKNVSSILSNTRNITIAGGAISLASNIYSYVKGDITSTRIAGNVSADMVGALGGGIISSSVGGMVGNALKSATCTSLGGLVLGTLAFAGTEILYKKTGLHQNISDAVTGFIDKLLNRQTPSGGW